MSLQDAEDVFLEMKRWLWLCAKRTGAVNSGEVDFLRVPLFNEAYIIDMMWHVFILFTQDYADFCEEYFGFFVHHHPRPKKEREAWTAEIARDPARAKQIRMDELRKVYSYLYDELGPDILVRWTEEFPARFAHMLAANR